MDGLLRRAWGWLVPPEVPVRNGQWVQRARGLPPAVPAPVCVPALERVLSEPVEAAVPQPVRSVRFEHPRASHQVQLCGIAVGYLFERSRRRSIGMVVGADGLRVRAPLGVGLAAVERVLQQKAEWIVRKLGEQQQRDQQRQDARIQWGPEVRVPYLGRELTIVLAGSGAGSGTRRRASAVLSEGQSMLQLDLGADAPAEQVRTVVQGWWLLAARRHFIERLDHFAPQLGVQWSSLRLSSARTRWGSARSDGSIRLNWRLLHYAPAIIDYVVVHELSHLRHMDHSPRFWATVASVVPDYRALRQQLRDQVAPLWQQHDV